MSTSPTTSNNSAVSLKNIWEDTADVRVKQELKLEPLPHGSGVIDVDVAIIGAGVSGLSAARAAAAAGAKTVLLERAPHAAAGASGKNAGIVCMGANLLRCELGDDSSMDWLWQETTELALSIYEEADKPNAFVKAIMCGSLTMATTDDDAAHFPQEVEIRRKMGLEAAVVQAADITARTGGRLSTGGVKSALWLPNEGRCHPWSLCAHLARQARLAGATLYSNAVVTDVKEGNNRWQILVDGGTTVRARGMIKCTGPTVEANKRIYALAFQTTLPEDFPVFQDAAPFTYFDYRTGDGHIVCTGGPYGDAADMEKDPQFLARMADTVRKWIPELAEAQPKYTWAVDLKVTPDMVPAINDFGTRAPGKSIVGLGALGVLPGILLGGKAAEKVVSLISD